MNERILVVDDEVVLRNNLARYLGRLGHEVVTAASGEEALEAIAASDFAVVITDLRMPGIDGLQLLRRLTSEQPEALVLLITANASLDSAIEALRTGAQDYLLKPLSLEEVGRKVARLIEHRELEHRVRLLRTELQRQFDPDGMIASAEPMAAVVRLLRKVAPTDSNVLLEGESGTGKELMARALHQQSARADRDFIPVNLAAQPEDLVDATLFGHERGAYTGASRGRPGVFRAAAGGTVFLDEVGELPAAVQVKLLRVIENREVLPLGSDKPVSVDFRLVAATNRPLRQLVDDGRFRQDLFFRLDVFRLELPPLRHRTDDIPALAALFLERHARSVGRPAPRLRNEVLRLLASYPWPGNIRELSNVLERAVLLADGDWITPEELPDNIRAVAPEGLALKPALEAFERRHIARVLARCEGNKVEAARVLEIHLATLYRHLERLGVSG
ncbi:MAG TPA: sigma-54-dependent Fis family transcriptional regulator [Deltaproteobacteria bacterium]|nr:sigma-54-dependent Fis family transcriptional regulator [Deltaproteobacteria bacterium]